eukprot:scaffold915_cov149-Pinguiococcus_pyrenoidosus.AAC.1
MTRAGARGRAGENCECSASCDPWCPHATVAVNFAADVVLLERNEGAHSITSSFRGFKRDLAPGVCHSREFTQSDAMGKARRRLMVGAGTEVPLGGESLCCCTSNRPVRKGFCVLSSRQRRFVGIGRPSCEVVGHARTVETHHEKFDLAHGQTRSNVDNQSGFCDVPLRCPHVRSDATLADQGGGSFFIDATGVAYEHLGTVQRKRLLLASRGPRPGEDVHGGRERSPRQIYTKKSLGTLQSLHTREVVAVEEGGSWLRARCQCARCRKTLGTNAWIVHAAGRVRRWLRIHFNFTNLQVIGGACWLLDPNRVAQAGTVTEESEGSLSG